MASGARSTASEHLKTSYVANKVETAKIKGENECLRAQVREMEEKLRQLGQPTQDESAPAHGEHRAKFADVVDVDECSNEYNVSDASDDSEESMDSASEYDDEGSSRSDSDSPAGNQGKSPPSTK
jgi:acetyl esterase/lipase